MKANPKAETVKVAVRVRPMNRHEQEQKSVLCVEVDPSAHQVSVNAPNKETKTFQFDYVYPMESTQREVYDQVAFPIVESIFEGYNGTVFAYGQTGCGKTFTMMGEVKDPNLRGVVPNAFEHIFGYINSEGSSKKFLLRCSFVEIYNEEVRDLLGNNPNKSLDVREDPKKGTFVKELSYTPLKNTDEIIKCLDKGNNNRHVGATSMNDKSSRSHSLFTVYLEIEEAIDEKNKKIRSGKLNLVDLAGSERVSKTNATGQTFDEGKKINLSLTALGNVIDALSFNRKHIPYKDSKLTRLLSDSLGGNTKTVMFANVSPASFNYDETVGTLRYASRAKLIKNAPKINEDPKDALLRKYEEEIKMLKAQLEGKVVNTKEPNANDDDDVIIEKPEREDNEDEDEDLEGSTIRKSTREMNAKEKEELLNKIALLEKQVIEGGKKSENDVKEEKKMKNDDKKNNFQEYRLQQLKNIEEMERKYAQLQEDKRKEEEEMINDANKLKKRIKYLKEEIEDVKYDNQRGKKDLIEEIKGINKNINLYKEILKFILGESELQEIKDLSWYDDLNEKWIVQPFHFKEVDMQFPTLGEREGLYNEIYKRDFSLSDGSKDQEIAQRIAYKNKIIKIKVSIDSENPENKMEKIRKHIKIKDNNNLMNPFNESNNMLLVSERNKRHSLKEKFELIKEKERKREIEIERKIENHFFAKDGIKIKPKIASKSAYYKLGNELIGNDEQNIDVEQNEKNDINNDISGPLFNKNSKILKPIASDKIKINKPKIKLKVTSEGEQKLNSESETTLNPSELPVINKKPKLPKLKIKN